MSHSDIDRLRDMNYNGILIVDFRKSLITEKIKRHLFFIVEVTTIVFSHDQKCSIYYIGITVKQKASYLPVVNQSLF